MWSLKGYLLFFLSGFLIVSKEVAIPLTISDDILCIQDRSTNELAELTRVYIAATIVRFFSIFGTTESTISRLR